MERFVPASTVTDEQKELTAIAKQLFETYGSDGKYILDGDRLILCQSNAKTAKSAVKTEKAPKTEKTAHKGRPPLSPEIYV